MFGRYLIPVFTIALLAVAGVTSSAAEEPKIAYVNMERAFTECDAGKTAKSMFTNKLEGLTRRIEAEEGQLTRMRDALEKSASGLSAESRRDKESSYREKYRNYQRLVKDSQEDLRREDNALTNKIVATLLRVVEKVGGRGGYTLVLEKKSVLFASQSIDITDEVVREMNKLPNPVTTSGKK